LEHKLTPLVNRNHGDLEYLISASTVPRLRDPVDGLSVLERVVAFGIVHVDRFPRRQGEDLWKVLVFREPNAQLALVQGCDAIESTQGIKDASLKEDGAWTCSVMDKVLDVHSAALPARTHTDPVADSVRACGDLE
jgi:hypothetical protein